MALSEICEYIQNGENCSLKVLEPLEPSGDFFCDYTVPYEAQIGAKNATYKSEEAKSCPLRLRQIVARTQGSPLKIGIKDELATGQIQAHWNV